MPQDCIGVDIAKGRIEVFHLSTSWHERISTTKQALAKFAQTAKGARGALVVLEASGGYERPVTAALEKAGVAYVRVNPRHAREFARASGRQAKTDRVDAEVLARMGRALELQPTPPQEPDRAWLSDLVARRENLVAMIGAEKNRAGTTRDRWLAREMATLIRVLEDHLATIEATSAALIAASPPLAADARRRRPPPAIRPRHRSGTGRGDPGAPAQAWPPRRKTHRRPRGSRSPGLR